MSRIGRRTGRAGRGRRRRDDRDGAARKAGQAHAEKTTSFHPIAVRAGHDAREGLPTGRPTRRTALSA
jgi:hypothetical protein